MCGASPGGVILLLGMHPEQDWQIQNTRKRTMPGEQRRNKRLERKGNKWISVQQGEVPSLSTAEASSLSASSSTSHSSLSQIHRALLTYKVNGTSVAN